MDNTALQKPAVLALHSKLPLNPALPFFLWNMSLKYFGKCQLSLISVHYPSIRDILQAFYIHFTWHFLLSSKYHSSTPVGFSQQVLNVFHIPRIQFPNIFFFFPYDNIFHSAISSIFEGCISIFPVDQNN